MEEDTHTIHWFGASWSKPEVLFFLENKHKLSLDKIDKKMAEIKNDKNYMITTTDYKILGIPLFKKKENGNKIKILLFGFIPLLKIYKTLRTVDFSLFNFISILKIKSTDLLYKEKKDA